MNLKLVRPPYNPKATIGELFIDGIFFCYTCEDPDRLSQGLPKVFGETAIPKGTYQVQITYSPRFKRNMPLLKGVKGFDGVRIHPGNFVADTEGCILVGFKKGDNCVLSSKKAYDRLMEELKDKIKIEIV